MRKVLIIQAVHILRFSTQAKTLYPYAKDLKQTTLKEKAFFTAALENTSSF